ncbi:MAG: type VI secretion system-associated protein TagO [Hyphomicrobiales bacterium]
MICLYLSGRALAKFRLQWQIGGGEKKEGSDMRNLLFAFLIYSAGVTVSTGREISDCVKIEDNISRLGCYDDVARPADVVDAPGEWRTQTQVSKIDDSTNVFLSLESKNEIVGKYGHRTSGPAFLVIRCTENTTALTVRMRDHFLSDNGSYGVITYRLDKEPSKKKQFAESTNNDWLGLWSGGKAIPFIKAMFGHAEILMEVTPFSESPQIAEFNISGIEAAVQPIRDSCGW